MTARQLYLQAKARLKDAGVDSPGFDAALLTERFLGLTRPALSLYGDREPSPAQEEAFLRAVAQRAERRPLQYILGCWPFMDLELSVGEGVLVPREETAVLVEALFARLQKGRACPRGLDLCSGTGAVALGLCSLLPKAEVLCVERDSEAWGFLQKNLAAYPQYRCKACRGDVLAAPEEALLSGFAPLNGLDFIASNPPYIASGELPGLQPEVRREPVPALDGGPDGLRFYRAILANWAPLLRPGGLLAVEIGDTQGRMVQDMFLRAGLQRVELLPDLAGLSRVVIGEK